MGNLKILWNCGKSAGTVRSNTHMLEYLKSSYLIFKSGEIVFPPDVSWEL